MSAADRRIAADTGQGASNGIRRVDLSHRLLAWRRASRPDSGRPARRRSAAFRDGWTAWRRRASRNPAAPRHAVSPWEAGAPRSAASRWEAAANPWLGAIAVLAYWKFESISLQR